MRETQKRLLEICKDIWSMRVKPFTWVDGEAELSSPENLVYKRLDGLRSILLPLASKDLNFVDYKFLEKNELLDEINGLVNFLIKDGQNFYPAPHTYTPKPQPDDYIDMAAHTLSFAVYCYELPIEDKELKSKLKLLAKKCLACLTTEGNYFFDEENNFVAWAGTTSFDDKDGIELVNVYFTSQAILGLSDWLKSKLHSDMGKDKNTTSKTERLLKQSCKWILAQQHHSEGILTMNESSADSSIMDNLIMMNADGLTACYSMWDKLDPSDHQRMKEISERFLQFLSENKPEGKSWYYQVYTKEMAYQFYADRQDTFGISTFLACAKERMDEKTHARIEEIAEYLIEYNRSHPVKELLIGSLPWFIKDVSELGKAFPGLQETMSINISLLRKALSATLSDKGIIEIIGKDIYRQMIDLVQKEKMQEMTRVLSEANTSKKKKGKK